MAINFKIIIQTLRLRQIAYYGIALTIIVSLAACGGGSGGSKQPQDTSKGTLALTPNTADSMSTALALGEGALQIGQEIVNSTFVFGSTSGNGDVSCKNGGVLSVRLIDTDSSLNVSSGDQVNLRYFRCYSEAVNGSINGEFSLQVDEFYLKGGTGRLKGLISSVGIVSVTSDGQALTINTAMQVSFETGENETINVAATGSENDFRIRLQGFSESLKEFSIKKHISRFTERADGVFAETSIDFKSEYQSDVFGGSLTCQSTDWRFANYLSAPYSVDITCLGLNRSGVRIGSNNFIELDQNGDDNYSNQLEKLLWEELLEGTISKPSGLELNQLASDLTVRNLDLSATDMAVDLPRNRALITTDAGSPLWPNALVALSLIDLSLTRLHQFSETQQKIAANEQRYFTMQENNIIHRFNANTDEALGTISVIDSKLESLIDIAASPSAPETIAIAFLEMQNLQTDIAILSGNSQLPQSLHDIDRYVHIEDLAFSSNGQELFITTTSNGFRIKLDDNGIAGSEIIGKDISPPLLVDDNRIYSTNLVMDEISAIRLGVYSKVRTFTLDNSRKRVYSTASGNLYVFDRDRYLELAGYDLNLPDNAGIYQILAAGDYLLLRDNHQIRLVDLRDIEVLNTDECLLLDAVSKNHIDYQKYDCPISDALYDAIRHKVYAAINGTLGKNGNSIAIINPDDGEIEEYIFIGDGPQRLALSPDGNSLNVSLNEAEKIVTIDLNSGEISREILIPNEDLPSSNRTQLLDINTYPFEQDSFLVTLGNRTSAPFYKYIAYRNGQRLDNELHKADLIPLGILPGPHAICDSNTGCFTIGNQDSGAAGQSLDVQANGLSAGASFNAGPIFFGNVAASDFADEGLFTDTGYIIDISTGEGQQRFDLSSEKIQVDSSALAVLNAAQSQESYFVHQGSYPDDLVISSFARTSGSLLGQDSIESNSNYFYNARLFEVGSDKLGLVLKGVTGLVIIPKPRNNISN